jgi:hypothetical protein
LDDNGVRGVNGIGDDDGDGEREASESGSP